ncbi:MAG: biotin--[acetyl-CoA-carboxylase] ligase [Hyphomicrobiales bacterium]
MLERPVKTESRKRSKALFLRHSERKPVSHSCWNRSMNATAPTLPAGYRLIVFDEIDSTNREAARLAQAGETGPVWVWANAQTKGQGRADHSWVSERGNLYATLMTGFSRARPTELGFAMALALYDAAARCLPDRANAPLALKWPNDLLVDGTKTAGILLETVGRRENDGVVLVAAGFGLNVTRKPAIAGCRLACLADFGAKAGVADALDYLAASVETWLTRWDNGRGFAAIRQSWLARAHGLGRPMTVRTGQRRQEGVFEDLAPDGALLLRLGNGRLKRILAGDIAIPDRNNGP